MAKLQDKGANILIPAMFALMVYLGAFGGSDAMIAGLINGFTLDEIGNSFAKGLASMAFVVFVIGLAGVVSLVMAGLDFDKWIKWAMPITIIFVLISFVIIFILTGMGWTGL